MLLARTARRTLLLLAALVACAAPPAPPPTPRLPPVAAAAPQTAARRVAFAILEDYDKGADLREVERDFALMRELGITTWRGSFGWDDYEPERGRYDFAWLHRFAELAARHGITLRPYLGYTPEWAAKGGTDGDTWNDPPRDVEDWYRFVRALAAAMRRHPNIASYEIYNEENVRQWWDGTPDEYARVLARGAAAVREGDPDAQVLFGGMVFPDADWVEAACAATGAPFDILPFHAYPETWTPDSVRVENYLGPRFERDFVADADAACGRKPIWINETGYATTPGRTERDQARWWARAVATFLAEPRVEQIGVYEIKDLPTDQPVIGDAPNYHLGLTRTDRTKKLAFHTVKMLVSLLGTDSLAVADDELRVTADRGAAGELHRHLFVRRDGRQVLVVWDRDSASTVRIALSRRGASAVEHALDGAASPYAAFDGHVLRDVRLAPGEPRLFEIRP
ncbi:MAG TPA: beta-galactosidase [Gemmatimonadaceae bacterium]|nr:beta-galactosidase [Gemmatimonadaceae bacterium]